MLQICRMAKWLIAELAFWWPREALMENWSIVITCWFLILFPCDSEVFSHYVSSNNWCCTCRLWFGIKCYAPLVYKVITGREIAPNTGANATKFFTLATKSWKLVAKLATRMFHHNLTKRYSELKRFAKINPQQTSSLSLFPKHSTCISIDN